MGPGWPEKTDHIGIADFFNEIRQERISGSTPKADVKRLHRPPA